jgi:magnesium chelatase family protein
VHFVLLDEAAEFAPKTLDSLRQPLESGRIVLHRVGGAVAYPARFQLIMATNPCPCASPKELDCNCSPDARRRYQRRLSGPLLDRMDLRIPVAPVNHADLLSDGQSGEASAAVADRVMCARSAARERWGRFGWQTNADVPGPVLRSRPWRPPATALESVDHEVEKGGLSARGVDRVLKLAWTIADLAGLTAPGATELAEAVWLRTGRAAVTAP